MAIVGALVHTEPEISHTVQAELANFQDVDVHPLENPGQIALVIERENINQVHQFLTTSVENTTGVLAVFPTYSYFDETDDQEGAKQ